MQTHDKKSGPDDQSIPRKSEKTKKSPKEEFFDTRYLSLSNLFLEMNINMTDFIPEKDLLQLLDNLCVREFDREVARGLFSKIPKQMNPNKSNERVIEVQDFIYTFIKAEYLLVMKAEEAEHKLAEVAEQIEALNQHINILKTKGGNIRAPIDGDEYHLNLEIVEVVSDDLDKKYPPNGRYTALVKYNGYKYETLEVTNEGLEFNPRFEHTFHLKIPSLQDKFVLSFRKYEDPKQRMSYVEYSAKFSFDLADQIRNEAWVELYDEQRRYTKEKMHIVLELQTENTEGIEYFLEKLEQLQTYEEELIAERELIYTSLRDLVEPFSVRGRANEGETPKEQTPRGDFREEKEPTPNRISVLNVRPLMNNSP